jgi:hypothetical protein
VTNRWLWVGGIAVPVVLAGLSWVLAGNEVWYWICFGGVIVGLILVVAVLRTVGQGDISPRAALVGLWLLLCAGLFWAVGFYFPLTTVTVSPRWFSSDAVPDGPTRVIYDGGIVAQFEGDSTASFQFRGKFDPALLRVESLGPAGWVKRIPHDVGSAVSLETLPLVVLYVDNRNHEPFQLQCGELKFEVPANTTRKWSVPALEKGDTVSVQLDGKIAGEVGAQNLLVDASGTRSYRWRELDYGGGLMQLMEATGQGNRPLPRIRFFSNARVHTLPDKVDYFLEPAPDKIQVTVMKGMGALAQEKRTELSDD